MRPSCAYETCGYAKALRVDIGGSSVRVSHDASLDARDLCEYCDIQRHTAKEMERTFCYWDSVIEPRLSFEKLRRLFKIAHNGPQITDEVME